VVCTIDTFGDNGLFRGNNLASFIAEDDVFIIVITIAGSHLFSISTTTQWFLSSVTRGRTVAAADATVLPKQPWLA
jgi:hypothetical protein